MNGDRRGFFRGSFALLIGTGGGFFGGGAAGFALAADVRREGVLGGNHSLRMEVDLAMARAGRWLVSVQDRRTGAWSDPRHPALTALALMALERAVSVSGGGSAEELEGLRLGYAFLRSQAKPDGGIYADALSNYNTALSVQALVRGNRSEDEALIRGAQRFLQAQQARGMVRPELDGGIGYGEKGVSPKRQHPDLDNTVVALEALRMVEEYARVREWRQGAALDWEAAIGFISRCQNLAGGSGQATSGSRAVAESERGGFVYYPGHSNAGEVDLEGGAKALRSSGTMTYAGLLSFLYAQMSARDERIQAALDWLGRHYTLGENPGLGQQGKYYYFHLMAKALSVAGVEKLEVRGASQVDWAKELAVELLGLQQGGGQWVNPTGRWMESDPVLVSSYSLLALGMVRERI
jgi:squalene-hopene/tetraprenyl-beta-curcumene cyclase